MKMETVLRNLWDAMKTVLRGKYTVLQVYLKKQQNKAQITEVNLHLIELRGKKKKQVQGEQKQGDKGDNNDQSNKK